MQHWRARTPAVLTPPWLAVVAVGAWAVFAALAGVVVADPPTRIDHSLQGMVARVSHEAATAVPPLRGASAVVAHLGAAPVVLAVTALAGVWWWLRRRTMLPATLVCGSYLLMASVVSVVKRVMARPEPYDAVGSVGRSFPSGHAASAVVVWGGVAMAVWLGRGERRSTRWLVTMAALAIVIAVAVVMVGRSAHWLSDIAAGLAVGVGSLASVGAVVVSLTRGRVGVQPKERSGRVPSAPSQ